MEILVSVAALSFVLAVLAVLDHVHAWAKAWKYERLHKEFRQLPLDTRVRLWVAHLCQRAERDLR